MKGAVAVAVVAVCRNTSTLTEPLVSDNNSVASSCTAIVSLAGS